MTDKLHRADHELDTPYEPAGLPGTPGKVPMTARLPARSTTHIVFRVESAEAARELAGAFGPRDANGVAAGADDAVSRAATSSGAPLPDGLRTQFESSLGADLSSVRVHTGDESAQAAKAVGARAYTTGQDIHFGAGHYNPSSAFGVHLLAHEVAHTVQQAGAAPTMQHKLEVSTPGDAAEVEADRAADAMVAGARVAVSQASGGAARQVLQRDSDGAGGAGGGSAYDDGGGGARGAGGGTDGGAEYVEPGPAPQPEAPAGSMTIPPPAPVNWGAAPPIGATPSAKWGGAPAYKEEYSAPGNLDTYRAAFDSSWASATASFNRVYQMHEVIRGTEKEVAPILRIEASARVGTESDAAGSANATDAFKGDKLADQNGKIDSAKVKNKDAITELRDKLQADANEVKKKGMAIADTGDNCTKANNALSTAQNSLKITVADADIEKLELDKGQVERDLEQTKADIAAVAESMKAVSSVVKCFTDPDPTNLVGNIFDAVDAGIGAGAAITESGAISEANAKLKAIDSKIGKLQATKKTLSVTNAALAIDTAKADVRIATRAVAAAVLDYQTAVKTLNANYKKLAEEMRKAGEASGMKPKDAKMLAAAVEAIPKIKRIIEFCTGLKGNIPTPPYNNASGIGCAMATNCGEFQTNLGIIKGTGDHIEGIQKTWEGRLASVEAAITSATASPGGSDW